MVKKFVKKFVCLGMTFVMLFSLVGCNGLAQYKEAAKAELDAYAAALDEERYNDENWEAIMGFVAEGKTAIDAAEDVVEVDVTLAAAKAAIKAVPKMAASFPSVLEEFEIEDFTEEFFEEYAVILVYLAFSTSNPIEFYTVYVENNELIVLIEDVTSGNVGQMSTQYAFIVIIPKAVLDSFSTVGCRMSAKYYFDFYKGIFVENPREWLNEIKEVSVEHRVANRKTSTDEVWNFIISTGNYIATGWNNSQYPYYTPG